MSSVMHWIMSLFASSSSSSSRKVTKKRKKGTSVGGGAKRKGMNKKNGSYYSTASENSYQTFSTSKSIEIHRFAKGSNLGGFKIPDERGFLDRAYETAPVFDEV